jgi:hypothetical protein
LWYDAVVASFPPWVTENWFALLQSAGIIFGLLFTAASFRRETRARQTSDLLTLAQQHRELWSELHRRTDLVRVLSKEADLLAAPMTAAEEEFLNVVCVHFYTGWLLAKSGALSLLPLEALSADVKSFFTLPLPKFFWRNARNGRDAKFVEFIDVSLQKEYRKSRVAA